MLIAGVVVGLATVPDTPFAVVTDTEVTVPTLAGSKEDVVTIPPELMVNKRFAPEELRPLSVNTPVLENPKTPKPQKNEI